jgi:S1-C subfamily serine protease
VKTKLVLLAMAMLIVAVPAMAGGDKCSAADAQVCLKDWAAKKSQGWLGAEWDKSVEGVVKVKAVAAESPAAKAGFEVGDEVTGLNGASMTDKDALKKAKGEWKAGQVVTYTIKRKGAEQNLAATLAAMPEEVFYAMLGRHMMEYHAATTTAAATDTKAPEMKPVTTDKK